MSQTRRSTATSSSNFQIIFHNALKSYERRTKQDLLAHPLAAQLQACDSPGAILAILHQQIHEFDHSRRSEDRFTKWLDPTVNVLYTFSAALGEGVGLVFSPAKVVFAGIGVLLLAAKDVRTSEDTLADVFETIENFFRRLETYTEVPQTAEMIDVIMKILVEILCILAIATKEIKQGRTKKYMKKLLGRSEMEDALKRLDKLTHEEARMATVQVLKATNVVDERVTGVAERVLGVDDRVVTVHKGVKDLDDRVAGVSDQVAGVDKTVSSVDDKVASMNDGLREVSEMVGDIADDGKEAKEATQQTANDVDKLKRNQLWEGIHKWLSPPDPSTNHNIACDTHHKRAATWFFEGSIFKEWRAMGSLLWVHGKPGSGKSVLCSTIIQDIAALCETGQASMGYFYFDFRDINKQHWHDLVRSLLMQLSIRSDSRRHILSQLYEDHDNGTHQPSNDVLAQCLKDMLLLPDQPSIYLIIDALDESPDTSGIPSPRERVLHLLRQLVDLRLPSLHICVTSRPEIDIRHVIEPLTSSLVSLHDQSGQKKDIVDYVRSIVYSESEPIMRRWRAEDKELVIETLSERADGMFTWVFCQLEALRHCLPPSVRCTLGELPESLDETYERILKEIKKPNRAHARRLLQCLVVATRPLHVEELAEVLAVDFDEADGIPKLNPTWRWEDQEHALLSSCSSLIAIVDTDDSRDVQFSHFSVKEFLISSRLATSSGAVSCYHISLEPAHITLAQACLGTLLQLGDCADKDLQSSSPLAIYSVEHWVHHAQFENVASHLHIAMQRLFDPDQPFFEAWLRVYNIDHRIPYTSPFTLFGPFGGPKATPLYCASLCGFHELVKSLVVKHPQHVAASCGFYLSPLVAALAHKHFRTAQLLRDSGADPDIRGKLMRTPLHSAAYHGDLKVVQELIKLGADVTAQDEFGCTPLFNASEGINLEDSNVIPLLLDNGADVNGRTKDGSTPLHEALRFGSVKIARLLLEHGADVEAKDDQGRTPIHVVRATHDAEMTQLLSEYRAKRERSSNL